MESVPFRSTRLRAGSFTGRETCQLYHWYRKSLRARLRRAVVSSLAPLKSCMIKFKLVCAARERTQASPALEGRGGIAKGGARASHLANFAKAF